jgi:hypothetical protein
MSSLRESLVRVHAGAFNAHDSGLSANTVMPSAPCWRDGVLVGEGVVGLRAAFEAEHATEDLFGQVLEVDGEPMVVEWRGPEGRREPLGVLRLQARGDRVSEVRIEHDAELARRLVERAAVKRA